MKASLIDTRCALLMDMHKSSVVHLNAFVNIYSNSIPARNFARPDVPGQLILPLPLRKG